MTASARRSVLPSRIDRFTFDRWTAAFTLALLAAPAPCTAQFTAVMQVHSSALGNIPGNSTMAGHQGDLQLIAFSMPSSGSMTGTLSVEPFSAFFRALTTNMLVDVTVSIDKISGGKDSVAYRIHMPLARFRSLALDASAGRPFEFDFTVASANGQVQIAGGPPDSKTQPTPPQIPKPKPRTDDRYQLRARPFRTPMTGDVSATAAARPPQAGTVIRGFTWAIQATAAKPMLGPVEISVADGRVNEILGKPSGAGASVAGTAFQWFAGSQKVLEIEVVNGSFWTPPRSGGSGQGSARSLPPGVYRIELGAPGAAQLVQVTSGGRTAAY